QIFFKKMTALDPETLLKGNLSLWIFLKFVFQSKTRNKTLLYATNIDERIPQNSSVLSPKETGN
ncbi:MAG: hypothetical protein SVX43_10100, partial [Cyanobacteriota bacterium]|nr:hypothetical protein [Cyanobacteriota bacterium]